MFKVGDKVLCIKEYYQQNQRDNNHLAMRNKAKFIRGDISESIHQQNLVLIEDMIRKEPSIEFLTKGKIYTIESLFLDNLEVVDNTGHNIGIQIDCLALSGLSSDLLFDDYFIADIKQIRKNKN